MSKNTPKAKDPWYDQLTNFITENKIKIPMITGVPKGNRSTKIGPTISTTLLRQMQIIKEADPSRFQIITDVERACLNVGANILYGILVKNNNSSIQNSIDSENFFIQKMQELNNFTVTMHQLYQCFKSGVLASDEDGDEMKRQEVNLKTWNELQRKHLDDMGKLGLKQLAEDKLKQVKGGEKITNLMELAHRGGKQ